MHHKFLSLVAAATLFTSPVLAQEEGTGETAPSQAHMILKNVHGLLENPFLSDFTVAMDLPDGSGKGAGSIAWSDTRHFAFKIDLEMSEGDQAMEASMQLVADGEFLYVDVSQGGQRQPMMPMKINAGIVDALMNVEQMPPGMPPINEFPKMIGQLYELEKGDISEDTRHWTCVAKDPEIDGPTNITLEFDKKTWFPKKIHATGAEGESILATASNMKFPSKIDPGKFSFEIPDGVAVMDMTAMIQMQFPGLEFEDEAIVIEEEGGE